MANPIVHPESNYKIQQVGPDRDFSFDGNDGNKVTLTEYQLQFEGIPDWVKFNVQKGADAPKVGEEIEGHIEDTGKFGLKFVKKRKGGYGGFGGGKGSSLGAQWSAAYETAAVVLGSYFSISEKKPKSIKEYVEKLDELAPTIKKMVDERAGTAQAKQDEEDNKTQSESGESPAPAEKKDVVIEDIDEDELGKW